MNVRQGQKLIHLPTTRRPPTKEPLHNICLALVTELIKKFELLIVSETYFFKD